MQKFMRTKFIIILIFAINLAIIGCKNKKSSSATNKDGYKCVVRVELNWDNNLSRYERDKIMQKYTQDSLYKSNGKDLVSHVMNNNDELVHFDFSNDERCKNKYQATAFLLDTYLKPIKKSPSYKIIKKELKKYEFKGLEAGIVY